MLLSTITSTWAVAASVGPVVGGGLAVSGNWRWFFCKLYVLTIDFSMTNRYICVCWLDMNLPICGVVGFLVFFFLRLKIPPGSLREKLGRVDWMYVITFIAIP